jgi:ribosomal protein S18 acetylase RimI-like enzyme
MAIEIRPARPDEHDLLGEIVVEAYRRLGALHGDEEYATELRDVASRAATAVVLVAADTDTGVPVGCATYVPGATSPLAEELGAGEASIRMLAVDPAAAGRGAGTALTVACLDRARADGFDRVVLHSLPIMEGAQRIYRRAGFRHVPERDWEPIPGLLLLCFVADLREG